MNRRKSPRILPKVNCALVLGVVFSILMFSISVPSQSLRANGKIAFTSDRDGNREIYVMNRDGTNQLRLTNNSIIDGHPAWSPNGRTIAFLSQRVSGNFALFRMNADGTGKTEITPVSYPSTQPYFGWTISWSPDGSNLVFQDGPGLYIVDVDGSNRRHLTTGFSPAWSPDGSRILFISGVLPSALNSIRPDGTDLRTLPPLPNFFTWYYDATWSPAGDKIAIVAYDGANEVIFLANSDGTNPQEFHYECGAVALGCSRLAMPDWSPDGNSIVFFALAQARREIYVKDIAGGESRRLTNNAGNNSDPSWQALPSTAYDFDSDGRADVSVFRPSDSRWYIDQSTQGFAVTQFGLATDKITPADYDGDGKTDIGVFRDGVWWRLNSGDSTVAAVQFGVSDDIPVPSDYTGDGLDEIAVYRSGEWWMLDLSNSQTNFIRWGLPTDRPVAADYDGDGRADPAVYRDGVWYLLRSALGASVVAFGLAADRPVVADYDGDGRADPAVYRDGVWYLLRSQAGFTATQFGLPSDTPVPADYDGDGKADIAVFRGGVWYLLQSAGGVAIQQFGLPTDAPVASVYQH